MDASSSRARRARRDRGRKAAAEGILADGRGVSARPYGDPLPTNRAVTLVKGNIGGEENEGPLWVASMNALLFTNATGTTMGKLYKYTPADNMLSVWKDNTACGGLSLDPTGTVSSGRATIASGCRASIWRPARAPTSRAAAAT
jgi:hypothetical protein